jgi:FeS assembly SUF system protein
MDKRVEQIVSNLKQVYDPEIPVNICDLGLIYNIDIHENNHVHIVMTLTAPGCPVADMLVQQVHNAATQVKGIQEANVKLVFDPPWNKSMMSEEAHLELGFF